MKNSRNKKFITDILIYGIGNLGSKMITFLLVPLYTYFIKPEEYGYYDLSLNIIFLMIPFVTLQLREGVFRFYLIVIQKRLE
jgi:Polysaccharide biosynthesis protein.